MIPNIPRIPKKETLALAAIIYVPLEGVKLPHRLRNLTYPVTMGGEPSKLRLSPAFSPNDAILLLAAPMTSATASPKQRAASRKTRPGATIYPRA
jgi:hypothetical protein